MKSVSNCDILADMLMRGNGCLLFLLLFRRHGAVGSSETYQTVVFFVTISSLERIQFTNQIIVELI